MSSEGQPSFSSQVPELNDTVPDIEDAFEKLNSALFKNLTDVAVSTAKKLGAGYSDIRMCRYNQENIYTREERVENIRNQRDIGFGVRVLVDGTWGFASSNSLSTAEVERVTLQAIEIAKANLVLQKRRVELEHLTAYTAKWRMRMEKDPFQISTDDKIEKLLSINKRAMELGVSFCSSHLFFVREEKYFGSSIGSFIYQTRVRTEPGFTVTMIEKSSGRFETRQSFTPPRAAGYEYIENVDLLGEVEQASEDVKIKLRAKPVEAGVKDLVIHPTNLWLTIHETIGHPTELDRALGMEANYAGTSFLTTDKLGKLQYGSPIVNIVADRTQQGGLATVGYDDDGIKTAGAEFFIIHNGMFDAYQMAIGQAKLIGQEKSNGCAYADSWDKMPVQRMPNISLQPAQEDTTIDELIADVKDGIYILGDGSWSIDQQRYNFQFGGQVFYEIKNGKLGNMLRNVAYQGNTIDFWNACDGLCGKSEYFLGGTFNCGKAQPPQGAPVSHGAVPARFRNINVLSTERSDL
ncbi:MAG: TldD/PmbA family protein [Chlorobiales bacterium]|jgi:TldD protein|nr:TldD/PmbA family protein [Chlorobiales bacterium]